MIASYSLKVTVKKPLKADFYKTVIKAPITEIPGIVYTAIDKHMTVVELKSYLSLKITGSKKALIWRLLKTVDIQETSLVWRLESATAKKSRRRENRYDYDFDEKEKVELERKKAAEERKGKEEERLEKERIQREIRDEQLKSGHVYCRCGQLGATSCIKKYYINFCTESHFPRHGGVTNSISHSYFVRNVGKVVYVATQPLVLDNVQPICICSKPAAFKCINKKCFYCCKDTRCARHFR